MTRFFWVVNPLYRLRTRLAASAVKVASHCASLALLLVAGTLAWQLAANVIHYPDTGHADTGGMVQLPSKPGSAATAAHIQDEHLFGNSSPSKAVGPVFASNGAVSVIGIAYSDDEKESVALLSVNGEMTVAHTGSPLATGEAVSRIFPDRVELSGADGVTTLLLGIKQADPNQRITPGLYAASPGPSDPGMPASVVPLSDAQATSAAHVTMAPTHFVSLQSLRGRGAAKRFEKLDAPIAPSKGH